MAIYYESPVTADALTAFVRDVPVDASLPLVNAFPTITANTNTVNFAELVRRNRTARFRSFDGRIHVSARDAGTRAEVDLLPLSTSLSVGEYERLQVEFARTGGTNDSALVDAIYNDGENLTREIHARLEQAWGDVLTDGILTINENGLVGFEADFGIPSDLKPTVATVWTSAAADIWGDLINWSETARAIGGARVGMIEVDISTLRLIRANESVIEAVYGTGSTAGRVSLEDLNTALADEGAPPIVVRDESEVDVDGDAVAVIPEGQVIMRPVSLADLGHTRMGLSATALELVQSSKVDLAFSDAPGIVGVVIKEGPPFRQFTFVDAVGMPILSNPRRLLTTNVR